MHMSCSKRTFIELEEGRPVRPGGREGGAIGQVVGGQAR